MATELKLPELGENIDSAQVLSVLVSIGDTVEKDQPVIELETDKATAEVPAEAGGVVQSISVKEGDEIKVGQTILVLDTAGAASSEAAPAKVAAPRTPDPEPAPAPAPAEPVAPASTAPVAPPPPVPAPTPAASALSLVDTPETTTPGSPPQIGAVAPASPSVRRLARELGLDINRVAGSGPGGRISEDDVKLHTRQLISGGGAVSGAPMPAAPGSMSVPALPDFSIWGEVEREPASKLRRLTAENMSLSWNQIPHVTQFDRADITDLNTLRKQLAPRVEKAGGKLTVTAIAVKAIASALKVFPNFNASYDAHNQELVYKKYVNVGVAVDTERGLLVPVIHNADTKNITVIATELGELAEKARTRKISASELQGANLNLSNLGGLGTTYFSPIVSWPQVAVVGMGRATTEAVFTDGAFAPRFLLPLAVSYDHRVIDGADAARFLRWVAEALEQPLLLSLEG